MNAVVMSALCAVFAATSPAAGPDGGEWQDPSRLSFGKEPPSTLRAPADAVDLSGVEAWRFKWSLRPSFRPVGFEKPGYDVSSWDLVTVPCSWQASGIRKSGVRYGVPLYVNQPYTFTPPAPANTDCPPKVVGNDLPSDWTLSGQDNPVGSYRRDFDVPAGWLSDEVFIRFEGVESFYYLWINGHYVGFAKDSRSPSVFNITRFLKPGKNVVAAEVYRFSDASYLECQDMFRLSGIIRPVRVYRLKKGHLKDVRFEAHPEKKGCYSGDWILSFSADRKAEFKVYEKGGAEVALEKVGEGKWRVRKPALWSAEEPNLYTLVTEGVSFNLGFREIEITEPANPRDRKFLINGKPVKLKGVNRSEVSPGYGHHCPTEMLRKDIEIIKKGNFNHIRNSHCPQPDEFYDLCDEYGIYVMDEANLESHGFGYGKASLSNRPEWLKAHLDRQINMVERNRNHPCIVMWSLGNEGGPGEVFKACYEWVKKNDPTRPVNYERNNDCADVGARQYPDAEWLRATAAGIENVKYPFHVNEFLHNLNNGAGSLKNFQDIIESSDRIFGGALWDYADQGLEMKVRRKKEKGKSKEEEGRSVEEVRILAFGGDFGEKPNEGQGMLDGIVHADRTPEPAYYEARHAYQPFDTRLSKDGASIVIESKNYFRDSSAWDLRVNGRTLSVKPIAPRERRAITLQELQKLLGADSLPSEILVEFVQREPEGFFERGWVIASDQILLEGAFPPVAVKTSEAKAKFDDLAKLLKFQIGDVQYIFEKETGSLRSIYRGVKDVLREPVTLDLMRGPVGGDMSVGNDLSSTTLWMSGIYGFRCPVPRLKTITPVTEENGVYKFTTLVEWRGERKEEFRGAHRANPEIVDVGEVDVNAPGYLVATEWKIYGDGTLAADATFRQFGLPFEVSRVGYRFVFDTADTKVDYLAAGPWDNYSDRRSGSFVGRYSASSVDFVEKYGRTCDCGNRMDAHAVRLDSLGLTFAGVDKPLAAFSVNPYSPSELIETAHPELLPTPEKTELGLFAAQRGLGSSNCGPPPEPQYIIGPKDTLRMSFVITPDERLAVRTLPVEREKAVTKAKLPGTDERMVFPVSMRSVFGGTADLRTVMMRFSSETEFWKFDGVNNGSPAIIWMLLHPKNAKGPVPVRFMPNLYGNHELTDDLSVALPSAKLSDEPARFIVGGVADEITRGRLVDPSAADYIPIRETLDSGCALLTCCVRDVFSVTDEIDLEWLSARADEAVKSICGFNAERVELDTSLCRGARIAKKADSCAGAEELGFLRRRVERIDWLKGSPENDALRIYSSTQRNEYVEFNYDESKAGVLGKDFTLEDPLKFADGREVKSYDDWLTRRKEILDLFEREVYGRLPPKPSEMTFEITEEKMSDDRFATLRRYRQYFRKDKTGPVIDWFVALPRHAKRSVPVFIHLNYAGLDKVENKKTNHFDLPWDMLVANGYAFMSAKYTQITGDGEGRGGFFNGVCGLWGKRDFNKMDNPGALMIWAWGFMRGLDLADAMPEIDAERNVVIGSSRLGKAALLAAAYDERIQVCVPNQTGAIGVSLMKRDFGESLRGQDLMFRHWYCRNVWKYADDPKSQPFDQHMLLACAAPRNLLLQCYHKRWFDPTGEYLAAKAAAPAWKLLWGRTLEAEKLPAAYDESHLSVPFGFVTRTECHGLSPLDWKWALKFANDAFKYVVVSENPVVRTVDMLPDEKWWGLATGQGRAMPFDSKTKMKIDLRRNIHQSCAPLLLSSRGRVVWCERPFVAEFSDGRIEIESDGAEILLESGGSSLRDAFCHASRRFFPPSGESPDPIFFTAPQLNTWIELTYNQNEKDILAYAESMLKNGVKPGIFMIDDTWQAGYGTWKFNPEKFPDPKGMCRKLNDMGFKIMLWMCPWVSSDTPAYRELATGPGMRGTGGFLTGTDGGPFIEMWWNGRSALLDMTNPKGRRWMERTLDGLIADFGAVGFKLDGGASNHYAWEGQFAFDKTATPPDQSRAWALLTEKYPMSDCCHLWKMGGRPVVTRLHDKNHSWDDLRRIIPDLIACGMVGTPFVCPDMIGGGQWVSFLPGSAFDEELFIRSAQVHALAPMMQFSASPWRVLSARGQDCVRAALAVREKFAARICAIAEESGRTGEPILRPLEFTFPGRDYAGIKDQFMMGDTVLVAPQMQKGAATRKVTVPPGVWTADDGSRVEGPCVIDVSTPIDRLPYFELSASSGK